MRRRVSSPKDRVLKSPDRWPRQRSFAGEMPSKNGQRSVLEGRPRVSCLVQWVKIRSAKCLFFDPQPYCFWVKTDMLSDRSRQCDMAEVAIFTCQIFQVDESSRESCSVRPRVSRVRYQVFTSGFDPGLPNIADCRERINMQHPLTGVFFCFF